LACIRWHVSFVNTFRRAHAGAAGSFWSGPSTYSVCSSILVGTTGAVNCWFCGESVHCVHMGVQAVFTGPMDWLLRVLLVEGTREVQKQHIFLGAP